MNKEFAVSLENVTIEYRSYNERPSSLKESIIKFIRTGKFFHHAKFNALENLTLKVERGTALGILGSNGAGKSTLLKVIAGVLPTTKGTVTTVGSLDCLIQLGAGFDAELNAIENIYLYSALRKRTLKEMKPRIASILEFAELTDFASTPMKYYSSGMRARLGFAVAMDCNPDIFVVDEVLSVGDARFRKKCEKAFSDILSTGKTIIMVSHDMRALKRICSEAVLLSAGSVVFQGDPEEAITRYMDDGYRTRLVTSSGV
jgi:ABC-type polysaccharide/polyol phosphate transport system ATPase subunit